MSEATTETTGTETKKKGPKGEPTKLGRRSLKALGRKKRKVKLATDREFAKTFFGAKSKRSTEKKSTFRKKKKGKK